MARPRKQDPASGDTALSREKIVEVALALIAEKGLDDFSLRDVARTLGVYPTALYWHIQDKNALLGEVCTLVMSKVVPPRAGATAKSPQTWQDWLRRYFRQYRRVMKQHPNLAQLVGARMSSNLNRNTGMIERILGVLEEAGCPDAHIVALYNTVIAAASGFATMEFAPPPKEAPERWKAEVQERVHGISALRHPLLARHLGALANRSFILRWQSGAERPMDEGFEAYLDVFVLGLEAKIAALRAMTPGV